MDKKQLSERDICTKFITPALRQAGWNEMSPLREEVSFTKGRIIVASQKQKSSARQSVSDVYFLQCSPSSRRSCSRSS